MYVYTLDSHEKVYAAEQIQFQKYIYTYWRYIAIYLRVYHYASLHEFTGCRQQKTRLPPTTDNVANQTSSFTDIHTHAQISATVEAQIELSLLLSDYCIYDVDPLLCGPLTVPFLCVILGWNHYCY